jgi:hypothetical protein
MIRTARKLALTSIGLLVVLSAVWGALAIRFSWSTSNSFGIALAGSFALVAVAALSCLIIGRWRWSAVAGYLVLFVVLVSCWRAIKPSNARDWQPDVAVLPYATVAGDLVTVHNIRNFDYRSETDYAPAYYDKRFNLKQLEGVDLVAVYWMGPDIAHVFLSFAFAGDEHLAISIETRKEMGEDYSTLKGFFRQYELFYVVADERDVIRLRTNYRHDPPEDVYVFRLNGPVENGRRLFLEYIARVNELEVHPDFYNTLTTNCTTNIWFNAGVNAERVSFSWKILASGHVPELLYELGRLQSEGLPFAGVQQAAHVNARAQAADKATDFSRRIRQPDPVTKTTQAQAGVKK